MFDILIFGFGFLFGAVSLWAWMMYRKSTSGLGPGPIRSVDEINRKASDEKQNRKGILLTILAGKKTVSNSEVQQLLEVSEATATNYLEELEAEGKIVQIGARGRSVNYKING